MAPGKWGRTLLGLPVLGPLAAAKGIAEKKGLTDGLVAHSPEDRFDPKQVAHWLEAQDLSPHTISVAVDDLTH
jgi:hypothetical protein